MNEQERRLAQAKEARNCAERIKTEECFFTAQDSAKTIRKAVRDGVITWDELETTDEKIGQIVIEIQAREAVRFLRYLQTSDDLQSAKFEAKAVRKAILDKAISWNKLKTTDEDISNLLVEIQVREARKYLKKMKEEFPLHIIAFTDSWIKAIRKAVSDKLINWDELGITEVNFNKLATAFTGRSVEVGALISLQQQI